MKADYLDDVREINQQMWDILQQREVEMLELEDFKNGTRHSQFPLGKKWLMKAGLEAENLWREIELRLNGVH